MDLRRLNALVAVGEHGGFSAAADALHTVQSNISAHVAHLEKELGVILVDRAAGRLTTEGEAVARRAQRVSAELEAMVADVAALQDQVAGTVRLGVLGTTGRWLAPPLLASLAERHPAVHLVIIEGTTTSLASQLVDSRLDLALVNLPVAGPDLQAVPLFDEDLVLVVAADDPMARRRRVDLRDLEGLMLLLPLRGTAFRDEIEAAARAAGVALSARTELDGVRLLASLTFEGNGPAILPATAVPRYLEDRWRPVAVTGLPRRRIGLASRRRGLPSAPTRAVGALIHEIVRAGAPARPGVHPVAMDAAMRSD